AHARRQDQHLGAESASFRKLCRVGCPKTQADIAGFVPLLRPQSHSLPKRPPLPSRLYFEILKITRTRIGGATEDEDAPVLVLEERLYRIRACVDIDGGSVGAEHFEDRSCISSRRIADLAPLR